MRIADRIDACQDGAERLVDLSSRTCVVVHRCSLGATAEEIATVYAQHPDIGPLTAFQMPYTIVVGPNEIEQALRLGDYGPHALAWSSGIGIAVVGDFRERPPSQWQYDALLQVCHTLSGWIGGAERIFGHDELEGGSRDPDKRCPGAALDMDRLRADVRAADLARVECAGFRR